jgi:hypothetical protein
MKKVLIISPNYPPVNAADMHRVRQSLPWFREYGWTPVIIAVDEASIEAYSTDALLLHTLPAGIEVHKVKAWDVTKTRKFGLGALGMRSYFPIRKKGDELLRRQKFDLIYFSTTAFHVMALGPRWKKKFGVPFVLDIQDPWRSDFYLDKPKNERPPKFFIAYNIDKYLEKKTVPAADGIISVSQGYCDTFAGRYPTIRTDRFRVIPFGVSARDFEVMEKYVNQVDAVQLRPDKCNIVYVGRGGHDLRFALEIVLKALAKGLATEPAIFSRLHFWFIGTSYAPPGSGIPIVRPLAEALQLSDFVTEITDRIPYFQTLFLLKRAQMLLIPGSIDTSYTASKVLPYVMAQKPLLAVFYRKSSVIDILKDLQFGKTVAFDYPGTVPDDYVDECLSALTTLLNKGGTAPLAESSRLAPYTAETKTRLQVELFDSILESNNPKPPC